MQSTAHSLLTPGVPVDAGEESLQEEPHANFHRHHNLEWTYVLLSKRWVIFLIKLGTELVRNRVVKCVRLLTICC